MTTETQTHTPGEWQVNGIDTILSVEGNCTIAKVFHPERDARLLAAAPELAKACKYALSHITSGDVLRDWALRELHSALDKSGIDYLKGAAS